jgi:hypothetical protein
MIQVMGVFLKICCKPGSQDALNATRIPNSL